MAVTAPLVTIVAEGLADPEQPTVQLTATGLVPAAAFTVTAPELTTVAKGLVMLVEPLVTITLAGLPVAVTINGLAVLLYWVIAAGLTPAA